MPIADHRVRGSRCPQCGALMDGATGLTGDRAPRPGDISICVYCQEILQFQPDGTLERIPVEVLADLALKQPRFYSLLLKAQSLAAEANRAMKENSHA